MGRFLSKCPSCCFTNGFCVQVYLPAMLEKLKRTFHKGSVFGVLLTGLSKAFDCLSLELIISKLNAFGVNLHALILIQSYLSNSFQRSTQINDSYGSWSEINFSVPQGLILGAILFNIFLGDLILVTNYVNSASYVDSNTIYDSGDSLDIDSVIIPLKIPVGRLSVVFR